MLANALMALAAPLGLAAYCLSHLLLAGRAAGRGGHYRALLWGCACGVAATFAASAAALALLPIAGADGLALVAMNLAAYLAFAFGYFNFINLNLASLRVRMLQELAEAGGELPAAALTGRYDTEAVIALRISRLTGGGHLVERQGRFYSGKRRFLVVGRIFDFLRVLILSSSFAHRGETS